MAAEAYYIITKEVDEVKNCGFIVTKHSILHTFLLTNYVDKMVYL